MSNSNLERPTWAEDQLEKWPNLVEYISSQWGFRLECAGFNNIWKYQIVFWKNHAKEKKANKATVIQYIKNVILLQPQHQTLLTPNLHRGL